jgi:cobalt/nickel transport system permease protein
MGSQLALLAVHISDGVLSPGWVIGGFVLMALLMAPAMLNIRDEEIPRIALLTAAFFVASLIHVRLGPTSVHLLLNGLVGLILGWRAGLAIPVGLALQAMLLGHGGFYAIGVNSCVMTIPALLSGGMFSLLRRVAWLRHRWFRTGLVAVVLVSWAGLGIFVVRLLLTNPRQNWSNPDPTLALQTMLYPPVALAILLIGGIGALIERRVETTPNMILGFFIGVTGVMTTLLLNAFVLIVGGAEDWKSIVVLVFLAHVPIAVLEGIVLGFTVSFLSRVKPDLLVGWQPAMPLVAPVQLPSAARDHSIAGSQAVKAPSPVTSPRSPALLLALVSLLLTTTPAWAHKLDAEYHILPDGRIQIESWFETGDSPTNARVQVFLPGDKQLTEGKLDKDGKFIFQADRTEVLRVIVNAGAGHRKELIIPKGKKNDQEFADETDTGENLRGNKRAFTIPYKEVMVGVGFLLATAAFAMSLRNAHTLQKIQRSLSKHLENNRS